MFTHLQGRTVENCQKVLEVSGAGEPAVNGLYELEGIIDGRPYYRKDKDTRIMFSQSCWVIEFSQWRTYKPNHDDNEIYVCTTGALSCPLTAWGLNWDEVPAPSPEIRVVENESRKRRRRCGALGYRDERNWNARKFTDGVIVCGATRIEVHRATLCAASPVFDAAFSSVLREGQTAEYSLDDTSPEAAEAMLRHIYIGDTDAPASLLPELLELAVRFELPALVEGVAESMVEEVASESVKVRFQALARHKANPGVESAFKQLCNEIQDDASQALLVALA